MKCRVLDFAYDELGRYLAKAGIRDSRIILDVNGDSPDDGYSIAVEAFCGTIAGKNERSVLFGVYAFLNELGFRFPTPYIEIIPDKVACDSVHLDDNAKYRHRGFCIEGAVSYENVLSVIDWLAKNRMNTYFTQFITPYEFFKTWYSHDNNPLLRGSDTIPSPADIDEFIDSRLLPEMRKRGLVWQAVGHGFNSECFGYRGFNWDRVDSSDGLDKSIMAEIDGKRDLFEGIPLNTNLCLSNKSVRDRFVSVVLDYLDKHRSVDCLHIWLADGANNSCQCDECMKVLPSVWYIKLLKEIDEALTEKHIDTRIVFLSYFDLLWPPETVDLNTERFIFMFAPITRSYKKSVSEYDDTKTAQFCIENNVFPKRQEENLAYAREWKKRFKGDSFVYEYHYMWNLFRDLPDYYNAKILYEDIQGLRTLGFNGYISCQQTRVFAPTGLGMHVMAAALWGTDRSFEELAREYFEVLFGDKSDEVLSFIEKISRKGYLSIGENDTEENKHDAALLESAIDDIEAFLSTEHEKTQTWQSLIYLMKITSSYFQSLSYLKNGERKKAVESFSILCDFIRSNEREYQENIDVYWFIKDRKKIFEEI